MPIKAYQCKRCKGIDYKMDKKQLKKYPWCLDCEEANTAKDFKEITLFTSEEIENKREALAKLEHEQWIKWSRSIISQVMDGNANDYYKMAKVITEKHNKWLKLWIPYNELSEDMKNEDRVWADKVIDKLISEVKE